MTTDTVSPDAGLWLAGDHSRPDLIVVGVPNSKSSTPPSRADLAPLEIRDALPRYATFHAELGVDFGTVKIRDMGNWAVSELGPSQMIETVTELATSLPETALQIFMGGDNAITRPLVAARATELSDVGMITFDARHDVETLEGGPTNRNQIRGLIEEHGLAGRNVVQIGVHPLASSASMRHYCNEAGITTVTTEQVDHIGIGPAVDVALSQLSTLCETIYVDVDISVVDRSSAPGTRSFPGGLSVKQLAHGLAHCSAHPVVSAVDIVEVDPAEDHAGQSVDVAAYLLVTAAAGFAGRRAQPPLTT